MNSQTRAAWAATPILLLALAVPLADGEETQWKPKAVSKDVHSLSNPDDVRVTHLSLNLTADFQDKALRGRATMQLDRRNPQASLMLDTRDLIVHQVTLGEQAKQAEFHWGKPVPHLGRALIIPLDDDADSVCVHYETSPSAKALQWLAAHQTSGGQQPFMFSQSQAILARTWIPCQDSPGVRMTYDATIQVPSQLMAVMSATNPQRKSAEGTYRFEMKQPIPSYLLALAIGDLEFRAMGKRSGIYAEPSVVQAAAWEFAQTERMMAAAEQLYGPYRWERYDILVLPPSFPFGGMENPRLTFATPTVLAGDRSLVALIAHELAHSWSGNLVTNATWNDFWLNEGFTVYFEHRIMEAVIGRDVDEMWARLGRDALLREMQGLAPRDTWLHLDLAGRDPDDALTDVAYDKGYLFLRMVEEAVGRDRWDAFLRSYFDRFAFQSMTTARFLEYLRRELPVDETLNERLMIDDWVYGPGLPPNEPAIETDTLRQVEQQAKLFIVGENGQPGSANQLDTDDWTTHHWLHFLRSIERPMPIERMRAIDEQFHFTGTGNSEVLHDWLLHSIAAGYEPAMPALEEFLTRQGRRKFLAPLYKELMQTERGRKRAHRIYTRARPLYHPVSVETIDDVLDWSDRKLQTVPASKDE